MKNYIHIKNTYNNNIIKHSTTPKFINSYYNKLNNLISPTNKRNNYINPIKKRNLNIFNYNKLDFNKDGINLNKSNNKIIPINKYSNLLSFGKEQNANKNNNISENNNDNRKKNISLSKIQDEIKMIQIKLRSDIIKSKIKLLSDISNDKKFTMNKTQGKLNNIYNISENNNLYLNYKDINKNYNSKVDKNYLAEKNEKYKRIYKVRKYNINTETKKILIRKRNIEPDDKNNYNLNNNTYSKNKQYNYFNNTSEENKFVKSNILKNEYESNIKSKIDKILERKEFKTFNMKNYLNNSDKNNKRYLEDSSHKVIKSTINDIINYNLNSNSKKSLINDNNNYLNYIDKSYNKEYKPRSFNDKFVNIRKKDKTKRNIECLSKDLPQGSFDNYFINNYSINNINNTTIYNNKDNKPIKDIERIDNNKYNLDKNKNIFEQYNNIIPDKKNFENKTEKKVINFSFINNGNNKRNQINQNNKNNSIINIVNFSFNPIKISYEQEIYIPKTLERNNNKNIKIENNIKDNIINNNKNNNIKENIANNENNNIKDNIINNNKNNSIKENIFNVSKNNNIKEKISENNKNNNIIENILNINKNNKEEKKNENKNININSIINHNNNLKNKINNIINSTENNNNIELDNNNIKNKEDNKLPLIELDELEQPAIILNSSIETDRKQKIENNNITTIKNKTISFNEIKTIIKYYENDYIKKSFIFTDNDFKKIKHTFLSTKDHIQNLKKPNKQKSILLVKEDKNKIKKDKLNLALFKLNELISEVKTNENKTEENINKNKQDIKVENKSDNTKIPFIKKNINFIKTIQEYYKKGINYRCLSKSEIKLLKKKKKNMCHKFQNNPQNFFSEKLCDNIIKSFDFNLDDSDATKMNKKRFIKKKLGNIKVENDLENKLNNSFNGSNSEKSLSFI